MNCFHQHNILSLKKAIPFFVFLICSIIQIGCAAVGPDYVPPKMAMPEKFNKAPENFKKVKAEESKNETTKPEKKEKPKLVEPKDLVKWWKTLDDPLLSNLVERAVKGNLDLKLAQSRVKEERARRGVARADRFPTVTGGGGATRQKTSNQTGFPGQTNSLYNAGFDATWEADLFGGIRRSVESAEATVEATQEALNDTLVTLVSEAALNYVEIRTFQARLAAAQKNQKAQEATFQLVQDRLAAGITTTLTLEQARYNLENTKSQIPTLRIGFEQAKNRLSVLLGKFPGSVNDELKKFKRIPVTPIDVVVGVPADVMRRRPDVRQAERKLAAQTAQIGVATAELYPKLQLLGSVGLESTSMSSLFTGGAGAFSIGPKITWNIFNAGRVRNNIKIQNAKQEQAMISYEASILTALNDVENSLIAYADEQVRRQALIRSTEASQRAVNLSRELYVSGLKDFLSVLEAERSLFSFQDQLAVSEGAVVSNLIRLYKALGGGWEPIRENTQTKVPTS